MRKKFEELTKRVTQSAAQPQALRKLVIMVAGVLLSLAAPAQVTSRGTLVEISLPNPLAGCNDGFPLPGNMTFSDACEPSVAVNPVNSANIVGIWTGGGFQGAIVGVSFDAGATWQNVPLPLTACAGGPWLGAGDVWVTFAPNGNLYAIAAVGQALSPTQIAVCKSTDGGLHWAAPVLVPNSQSQAHGSITADPFNPQFVYAIWNGSPKNSDPAQFSRSTDAGLTWESAQEIFSIGPTSQGHVSGSQICVLPDTTLVALNQVVSLHIGSCPQRSYAIAVLRSSDKGQTWSAPVASIPMAPFYQPCGLRTVFDPNTGQFTIQDGGNPSFAVDGRNGTLYAVWEDGRWANFQGNDIAFAMSADGGFTWSAPVRVNQTPVNIPAGNRQAFLPTVAVAADGTIGVTYYDFRFNGSGSGLLTDYWLVQCQPSATRPTTNSSNWGNELRLTDASFNLEAAFTINGFFLGDYMSLAGDGKGFVAVFTAVDQNQNTAIFARRVGP